MDCSTIDPSIAQTMAKLAQEKGAMFVDAPVSGGKLLGIEIVDYKLHSTESYAC